MTEVLPRPVPKGCDNDCQVASSIEALNRSCFCLSLDEEALRRGLEADLGSRGLSRAMVETHPHLFSSVPMFVSREHLEKMARVVSAVEAVVATSYFLSTALAWAPEIARYDPGSPGGLLGYDFHLAPMEADAIEAALIEILIAEWHAQKKGVPLMSVAIVDEAPEQQYLYPEFLLYRQLFGRHGIEATICDPRELAARDGRLWKGSQPIDFVYNRLTDFALAQPAQAPLALAYLAREVGMSPHPRAHALYADKRNLTLLCDEAFLRATGVADDAIATLLAAIPRTEIMTAANRDALWARRRQLFFKPAAGYASKAAYRGDKLTRRVWEEMAQGTYVAQALVAPSERHIGGPETASALKADVRNYASAGEVKLVAARLYQGQTTNFRTPGGGFAPVFTEKR
jgi:hypothetical protein